MIGVIYRNKTRNQKFTIMGKLIIEIKKVTFRLAKNQLQLQYRQQQKVV